MDLEENMDLYRTLFQDTFSGRTWRTLFQILEDSCPNLGAEKREEATHRERSCRIGQQPRPMNLELFGVFGQTGARAGPAGR